MGYGDAAGVPISNDSTVRSYGSSEGEFIGGPPSKTWRNNEPPDAVSARGRGITDVVRENSG
jgi:hypothetical protein